MKIVGVTQGSNLKIFLRLVDLLRERSDIEQVAAFVSDSMAFKNLFRQEPQLRDGDIELLKEWEIFSDGLQRQPNWKRLNDYEQAIGDPVFWNALMADRRIFYGRRCKIRQDYRPRFSYIEMAGILEATLEAIEEFLEQISPSLVLGFGTSTIGDYLFYLFAKKKGIPYLQLKATKVGNRIALNDDAIELSEHVSEAFLGFPAIPEWAYDEARSYINRVRQRGVHYEGAISKRRGFTLGGNILAVARGIAVDIKRFLDPVTRLDNHPESMFFISIYERFINPVKGTWIEWRLGRDIVDESALALHTAFAFFPLHFEPEVSLQVFGRPHQNQIEVIRSLAASLPVGMFLLVKEHPRGRGFRPLGYYRKLLEIPNVRMVDASLATHQVARSASLVIVISGSTGLEAAILERPVITLGKPVYNILQGNMIRHVTDLYLVGFEIRELLANHYHDEPLLERYVAATVAGAVPVDLYTSLLGKVGRMREGREEMSEEQRRQEDYSRLADYCLERIRDVVTAGG